LGEVVEGVKEKVEKSWAPAGDGKAGHG